MNYVFEYVDFQVFVTNTHELQEINGKFTAKVLLTRKYQDYIKFVFHIIGRQGEAKLLNLYINAFKYDKYGENIQNNCLREYF